MHELMKRSLFPRMPRLNPRQWIRFCLKPHGGVGRLRRTSKGVEITEGRREARGLK